MDTYWIILFLLLCTLVLSSSSLPSPTSPPSSSDQRWTTLDYGESIDRSSTARSNSKAPTSVEFNVSSVLGIPSGYSHCSQDPCDSFTSILCSRVSQLSDESYFILSKDPHGECTCCWKTATIGSAIEVAKRRLAEEYRPPRIPGQACRAYPCDSYQGITCTVASTKNSDIQAIINPYDGNDCFCCIVASKTKQLLAVLRETSKVLGYERFMAQ